MGSSKKKKWASPYENTDKTLYYWMTNFKSTSGCPLNDNGLFQKWNVDYFIGEIQQVNGKYFSILVCFCVSAYG